MSSANAMRVAIVGGTGFVGRAIHEELNQVSSASVTAFGSGEVNLLDSTSWRSKGLESADVVVLAAGIVTGTANELQAANVDGLSELASYCGSLGTPKIILISSGAVYGGTSRFTSPDMIATPDNQYGKSKLLGEVAVRNSYHGNLNILRLYFPYGPGENLDRLIPRLKLKIIRGEPISCRSDGGPFISLMHKDDMARVIVRDFLLGYCPNLVINLSSNIVMSIREISMVLASGLNKPVHFQYEEDLYDTVSVPFGTGWRSFSFY
jgi:nucleoside-diphosphate-sugar epimerase